MALKAGFATLSAFPLVPAHAKMVPRKGHHLRFKHPPGKGKHPPEGDQASVSSWNCGIGVTGG